MTLDLNQLHVESFATSTGAPELMPHRGGPTNEVILCAQGALAQPPAPTENPEYC